MLVDYYYSMWDHRDKRTDGWFLMSSIWPTFVMCVAYVLFSKIFGPAYMRSKKPMEFKGLMMIYNIVQVLSCLWMFVQLLKGGWATYYNQACQPVDLDARPGSRAMIMVNVMYWFFMSKLLDFVDTVFFVIRKKDSQITGLHVFHHAIMPLYTWINTRWLPGGQESFGALINSLIHVLMYSYYFLSALGAWIQPYLWWKRYLTRAQMVQFVLIFIKCNLVVFGVVKCDYPWQMSACTAVLMIIFFALFFNFYLSAYKKKAAASKRIENGNKIK